MKIDCAYDELVDFDKIVGVAKEYVKKVGGFEKLAEWGLR